MKAPPRTSSTDLLYGGLFRPFFAGQKGNTSRPEAGGGHTTGVFSPRCHRRRTGPAPGTAAKILLSNPHRALSRVILMALAMIGENLPWSERTSPPIHGGRLTTRHAWGNPPPDSFWTGNALTESPSGLDRVGVSPEEEILCDKDGCPLSSPETKRCSHPIRNLFRSLAPHVNIGFVVHA